MNLARPSVQSRFVTARELMPIASGEPKIAAITAFMKPRREGSGALARGAGLGLADSGFAGIGGTSSFCFPFASTTFPLDSAGETVAPLAVGAFAIGP